MKSYQKSWVLSEYKAAELEIFWGEDHCGISWFTLKIESREKCDHPGIFFEFSFLRLFSFNFSVYDVWWKQDDILIGTPEVFKCEKCGESLTVEWDGEEGEYLVY
jgi:hypothetical protein